MKTTIEWRKGSERPTKDGTYIVLFIDKVTNMPFTVKYGWNTTDDNYKYPIDDVGVNAWAEINDLDKVMAKYGQKKLW